MASPAPLASPGGSGKQAGPARQPPRSLPARTTGCSVKECGNRGVLMCSLTSLRVEESLVAKGRLCLGPGGLWCLEHLGLTPETVANWRQSRDPITWTPKQDWVDAVGACELLLCAGGCSGHYTPRLVFVKGHEDRQGVFIAPDNLMVYKERGDEVVIVTANKYMARCSEQGKWADKLVQNEDGKRLNSTPARPLPMRALASLTRMPATSGTAMRFVQNNAAFSSAAGATGATGATGAPAGDGEGDGEGDGGGDGEGFWEGMIGEPVGEGGGEGGDGGGDGDGEVGDGGGGEQEGEGESGEEGEEGEKGEEGEEGEEGEKGEKGEEEEGGEEEGEEGEEGEEAGMAVGPPVPADAKASAAPSPVAKASGRASGGASPRPPLGAAKSGTAKPKPVKSPVQPPKAAPPKAAPPTVTAKPLAAAGAASGAPKQTASGPKQTASLVGAAGIGAPSGDDATGATGAATGGLCGQKRPLVEAGGGSSAKRSAGEAPALTGSLVAPRYPEFEAAIDRAVRERMGPVMNSTLSSMVDAALPAIVESRLALYQQPNVTGMLSEVWRAVLTHPAPSPEAVENARLQLVARTRRMYYNYCTGLVMSAEDAEGTMQVIIDFVSAVMAQIE